GATLIIFGNVGNEAQRFRIGKQETAGGLEKRDYTTLHGIDSPLEKYASSRPGARCRWILDFVSHDHKTLTTWLRESDAQPDVDVATKRPGGSRTYCSPPLACRILLQINMSQDATQVFGAPGSGGRRLRHLPRLANASA